MRSSVATVRCGEPLCATVGEYGAKWLAKHTGEKLADYKAELEFFRPGLKEYFFNLGAGHYRLDVSDDAVTMAFYPGDAKTPARPFDLWTNPKLYLIFVQSVWYNTPRCEARWT